MLDKKNVYVQNVHIRNYSKFEHMNILHSTKQTDMWYCYIFFNIRVDLEIYKQLQQNMKQL